MEDKWTDRSTEEVLDHHVRVLAQGELEEVLKDYAEDAVLIQPDGIVRGHDELRAFFKNSIENCLPPDARQTVEIRRVCGQMAYIVWNAESRFCRIPFGTDTFVVQNGKIVMQSYAGITEEV